MLYSRRYLSIYIVLYLIVLLMLSSLLNGCGGNGSAPAVSKYAGKTLNATKMSINTLKADLQVNTSSGGSIASGTLTITDSSRGVSRRTRLVIAAPNCNGTYDPMTGALSLTGTYEYPAGTAHIFTIIGTLPVPPSNTGSLTITLDGTAYGPYVFGDNTSSNGGNGGGGQSNLTISNSTANTIVVKNGAFTGTPTAGKIVSSFNLGGVQYDGQYTVDIAPTGGDMAMDIFGLSISAGQTFDFATSPRTNLSYLESGKAFTANGGTFTVTAISSSSITINYTNVHFIPSAGSVGSTGGFTLNGTLTSPVTLQ